MSKSLGNVLDPFQVIDVYGADALRFYLLREVRFGQDGAVSPEGFETRYGTELANEYGNLASRTLAMIARYRDGVVPDAEPPRRSSRADFDGLPTTVAATDRPRRGQRGARGGLAAGPRAQPLRRRTSEPWKLAKDDGAPRSGSTRSSTRSPRACAWSSVLLHPFMPDVGGAAAGGAGP